MSWTSCWSALKRQRMQASGLRDSPARRSSLTWMRSGIDAPERRPLFGIPFVIKDNIDLAGVPTTAGCPAFAYLPARSAFVVERLIDAGAIPIGKANLDQFATGLVGTRSPYGACRNSFNPDYIAGGSSSGSAVAVARGLASFALGTDTAGSGRVPAAFNNIVGLKPSLARLSSRGVVPACRSLDCVSIFALTAPDAARVLSIAEGYDREDPYSRPAEDRGVEIRRIGIPGRDQLKFFGTPSTSISLIARSGGFMPLDCAFTRSMPRPSSKQRSFSTMVPGQPSATWPSRDSSGRMPAPCTR